MMTSRSVLLEYVAKTAHWLILAASVWILLRGHDESGGAFIGGLVAVVATALEHHLVSKFTSLIAVDKTPVRPSSANLDKEQVPNLLPYGQSQQAIFGFPATATSAPLNRLIGMICLLVGLFMLACLWKRGSPHDFSSAA